MVSSNDICEMEYRNHDLSKEIYIFTKVYLIFGYQTIVVSLIRLFKLIYFILCYIGKYMFIAWDWSMEKLGKKKIILDRYGKEPYLVRYYLLFKERQNFPFNIFIHHIIKSDEEDLHDHPWSFITFILRGGYYETTLTSKKEKTTTWYPAGSWRKVKSNHLHRIQIQPGSTGCWTLFIPFRREKKWGFMQKSKRTGPITRSAAKLQKSESFQWVSSDVYLKDKSKSK